MNNKLIYYPVLLQIALTMGVYIYLAIAKGRASRLGQVDLARRALDADAWPDSVRQVSNNLRNQFEAPLLFYVLALMLVALDAVDPFSLAAAWGFSLSRLLHAAVHLRSNHVPTRRRIFTIGCVFLVILIGLCLAALIGS